MKTEQIPVTEPERQYYYMDVLKSWMEEQVREKGRKLTYHVQTFGCQMNAKDSEKLAGILETIGYVETDTEKADFVIYNTCTVRENANTRVYGRIGYLGTLKRKNPDMKIAMCGCMMQEAHVVEKIKKSYRFVDIVFGTHNIFKLAELLFEDIVKNKMVVDIWDGTDQIVEDLPSEHKYVFKAGVNIMYGCNNFCSYCIVPYVRGRERSRKPEDIIAEVKKLAAEGIVEIMLLGQNVNSYGKTLAQPMTFAELLREVEKVDGIRRIRFMTSHPKDLSDELIEVMRTSKKICTHLHLPMQSGSTRILKEMNRKYTKEDYLTLVDKIKAAMPEISLTTDIIVGFPGETKEDFMETVDVVRKVGFDSAYTFIYSKRSGTVAAKMENQVPEEQVKEWFDILLNEIKVVSEAQANRYEGTTMEVLVEEVNTQGEGMLTGRLSNNLLVHFPGDSALIGTFVNVYLRECKGFYYIGEIVQ
ncbi:MAG: tRNA (N6-isopentenyl adenosine(37)-C2)-methylthiotransferase MiaB [Lachnospiraceae bacterium]|nr:tRNA (N6-isopentenyl adenosine(37)-C2)-methylthiotransferase MiaB [Lachnospiraceae bacterium]